MALALTAPACGDGGASPTGAPGQRVERGAPDAAEDGAASLPDGEDWSDEGGLADADGAADAATRDAGRTSGDAGAASPMDAAEPLYDAGPPDGVCLGATPDVSASGTGACDDPFVIDLSNKAFGHQVSHSTGTNTTDGDPAPLSKCGATTGRDVVYNVRVPAGADLEVSVDGVDGADAILLVQASPDATCSSVSTLACVDEAGVGECEYLRLHTVGEDLEGTTRQILVSEATPSGTSLHLRLRLIDPEGGS